MNICLKMLKSLMISYIVTAVILLLLALGMYKFQMDEGIVDIGIMITYGISNLVGARLFAGKIRKKRIFAGCALSAMYLIVLMVISLLMNKGMINGTDNLIRAAIISILGGVAGGFVSPVENN